MSVSTDDPSASSSDDQDRPATSDVVMTVSEAALETVLGIRADEDDPTSLGLRVAITGIAGTEFAYDLSFEGLAELDGPHVRYEIDGLTIVIPEDTVENLQGAELDLPRDAGQGGLVIRNPNRPDPLAGITVELSGDLAERVAQLLEQSINPALAAHGGYATLVGIDDENKVYVTMGGGCQGCSVSAITLSDGIKKAILEHVPEIVDVIDATDHTAGENPFYTE
jgi:Fe/S biogenesis protein NfuA